MVPVTETVVNVDTVMIKLLNTLVADHAMKGPRGLDQLAVEAEVLQIDASVVPNLEEL